MAEHLPTSLVGSYAQPDWLIDREKLAARFPPRVRARELWRVDPRFLEEAQDDATLLAIRDQERAGLDIVTDGEMRRESYSNRFATALDGGRPRQSRHRARPQRPPEPGAARRRADRAQAPGPGRATSSSSGEHRPPGQDHRARARSRCPSRPRTTTTRATPSARWPTPPPSTPRSPISSPPARTSSRSTSPTCRRDPRRRASSAAPRSSARSTAIAGTTAVHICFGYAAIIHERPSGYSFLTELGGASCDQISIETAQSEPRLLGARERCPARRSSSACSTSTTRGGVAGDRGRADPPRAAVQAHRRARGRARLRHEVPAARGRVRQAPVAGRRCPDGARRVRSN